MKRWIFLLLGMFANLAQGVAYAASVIAVPMMAMVGVDSGNTKSAFAFIFTMSCMFLPIGMIAGGKLANLFSPRIPIALGAFLYGTGLFASGYVTDYNVLCITFGLMLSIGSGLAYGSIVANAVRWFPDKKGLASGLVVSALGFGPVLIAPICAALLKAGYPISTVLQIFGVFSVVAMGLASFITSPKELQTAGGERNETKLIGIELTWFQMLRTKQFWFLAVLFFLGTAPGLMIISGASGIFRDIGHFELDTAATLVAVLAAANALGRFLWGAVSDKIGRLNALLVMFVFSAAASFLLPMSSNPIMLVAVIVVVGTTYGGHLGLFPSFCADAFGLKNLPLNYAVLFIAFSAASLAGPRIYASFSPKIAFFIATGLSLAGFGVSALYRRINNKVI